MGRGDAWDASAAVDGADALAVDWAVDWAVSAAKAAVWAADGANALAASWASAVSSAAGAAVAAACGADPNDVATTRDALVDSAFDLLDRMCGLEATDGL